MDSLRFNGQLISFFMHLKYGIIMPLFVCVWSDTLKTR